jgi:hypothetical protein
MTKEEKVEWDRAYARVEECDREIAEMTASLKLRKNKRYRQLIEMTSPRKNEFARLSLMQWESRRKGMRERVEGNPSAMPIRMTGVDPLLPFKTGPANEREARESGL